MNKVLLSAISFLAISVAANAAINTSTATANINIVNQNKKAIDVRFEASDDSNIYFDYQIPATAESKFTLTSDNLKGKKIFFVKGSSNSITSDKCKDLHIDKSYELVFTNDSVGTTCVATEMTEDMKSKKETTAIDTTDHHMNVETKTK